MNGDLISKDRNLAGKSDYTRMEILYLEGGIYQDTDAHPIQPFDNFGDIFRWPFGSYDTSFKVSKNGCFPFLLFFMPPSH